MITEAKHRGDGHDDERKMLARAKRERKAVKRLINKANGGFVGG